MLTLSEVGAELATARKVRGLGQLDLARKAGVSRATIDLLENGRAHDIGYSRLNRILFVLGLELALQATAPERPTLDELLNEAADD